MRKAFASFSASHVCRQESPSSMVRVGCFLWNKTSPAEVTTFSNALACILSYKNNHCHSDEIPNLRLELVIFEIMNTIMIWAIALLVQYHSSDVKRNKLVSSFSSFILLLNPGLIESWKSCPCGKRVLSNSTVSLSKISKLG